MPDRSRRRSVPCRRSAGLGGRRHRAQAATLVRNHLGPATPAEDLRRDFGGHYERVEGAPGRPTPSKYRSRLKLSATVESPPGQRSLSRRTGARERRVPAYRSGTAERGSGASPMFGCPTVPIYGHMRVPAPGSPSDIRSLHDRCRARDHGSPRGLLETACRLRPDGRLWARSGKMLAGFVRPRNGA